MSRVRDTRDLTSEAVQGTSLSLQSIDDIHGRDRLSLGMLRVGDSVTDDVLQENLEDATSLFVDEAGDSLDTPTTSQTPDGGFGDSLDVVAQNLTMSLGSPLPEPFASLSSTRHGVGYCSCLKMTTRRKRQSPAFLIFIPRPPTLKRGIVSEPWSTLFGWAGGDGNSRLPALAVAAEEEEGIGPS